MSFSADQQLLQYPFKPLIAPPPQLAPHNRPHQIHPNASSLRQLKLIILVVLTVGFLLYRWIAEVKVEGCVYDLLHEWTQGVNYRLNNDQYFYQALIIIAQQSIQLNIFFICILSTWKVNNLKAHLIMGLFYGIRGVLLNIERFPYPPNIRWDEPWIPSFTVPYGITRDYFYSGHTGLMLFSTFWWKHIGYTKLYLLSLSLTPLVILVLLSTRVHYSIDIIAAAIFIFWLEREAVKKVKYFDRAWSVFFLVLQEIVKYIRNLLV